MVQEKNICNSVMFSWIYIRKLKVLMLCTQSISSQDEPKCGDGCWVSKTWRTSWMCYRSLPINNSTSHHRHCLMVYYLMMSVDVALDITVMAYRRPSTYKSFIRKAFRSNFVWEYWELWAHSAFLAVYDVHNYCKVYKSCHFRKTCELVVRIDDACNKILLFY